MSIFCMNNFFNDNVQRDDRRISTYDKLTHALCGMVGWRQGGTFRSSAVTVGRVRRGRNKGRGGEDSGVEI